MKNTSYKTTASAMTILFAIAPLAHAAIVAGNTSVVNVNTDGAMHSNIKTSVTSTSSSGMKMGGKMEVDMDSDTEMHSDMKNGNSGTGTEHMRGVENAEMHADEHAEAALEKVELHLEDMEALKADVEADKAKDAGEVDIDTAAKVHSSHDFEHFVAHKAKEDSRIKEVSLKDGEIEVVYEEPAKLFGFMKTTINAHASVDAKGETKVEYPWYHIFMKNEVSNASLQSEVARAIAAAKKGEREGVASTTMQAKIEAKLGIPDLFETLVNTLKSASIKAEAEASA